MVRIGDVWDSTTDVLAGRAGLLAPIAAAAFFLPSVLQSAVKLYGGPAPGIALLAALIGLVGLIATLWGQLAVIAVASDPATTRAEAGRLAARRLPAALLVALVFAGAAILLFLPILLALILTGYDFAATTAFRGAGAMPAVAPGAARFIHLYGLALFIGFLWLSARLFLTSVVVLNEGRAIGAIGRSIALTRGLTWKLIGVAVLFGIVFFIAWLALGSVVGLAARFLLGAGHTATVLFLAGAAGAALSAAFLVLLQVFGARLYAGVTGEAARGMA